MAKDIFHDIVRMALEKDGWTITHDPYPLRIMGFDLDVDLGVERILAAERQFDEEKKTIVQWEK